MNKRKVGNTYETAAAEYLTGKGFQILERNYRIRTGEIDMVARDGRYLVFVEVKYRADAKKGAALEAVDIRKQRVIKRTAQVYLRQHGLGEETPCRFDVIGITGSELVHIKDAFWM